MWVGDEGTVYADRLAQAKAGQLRQFVEWIETRQRTPDELLGICLERIAARDTQVHAWVQVEPQPALGRGPLAGIPFGVKDIYETRELATEYGSAVYAGRKGSKDAALVTQLRQQGAVLIGKTHTTAFAYFDAGPTRNPHNLAHTPGGSSSGSAAAVAAGMAPFALGTQTLGSILRPASFCGVVGFKPSAGSMSLDGVLPFAPSLDTAGLFTQTADDMELLWTLTGHAKGTAPRNLSIPSLMPCVEPAMEAAFRRTVERLAQNFGIGIVEMPERFRELGPAVHTIFAYEGARTHEARWREHGGQIGQKLASLIEEGLRISTQDYHTAVIAVVEIKRQMSSVFRHYPVLITPAAPGPAPEGLQSTGDPVMNSPWTALGVPAISVPMPVLGLPLGIQFVSESGTDGPLLALAAEVESLLQ
jgi:Asp-tRNA(Asn)/Glu-tRNA(Gln) amidotransferase A subunit family amidase